jgi:hypothetical protein
MLIFTVKRYPAHPIAKLEEHRLSAVCDCLFSIFERPRFTDSRTELNWSKSELVYDWLFTAWPLETHDLYFSTEPLR